MSEHSTIVVGLKEEKINGDKKGLYYIGYGCEYGAVWTFKIAPSSVNVYRRMEDKEVEKENSKGTIYGIPVAGTWAGVIDLEKVSKKIKEAKQLFKKLTGQEGKTYFIGEQI